MKKIIILLGVISLFIINPINALSTTEEDSSNSTINDVINDQTKAVDGVVKKEIILPTPNLTVTKKALSINDTFEAHFSGMDFVTDDANYIQDHYVRFFTEKYTKGMQIEYIEIPYYDIVKIDGSKAKPQVRIMAHVDLGYYELTSTEVIEEGGVVRFYRDEMLEHLAESNNGEWPNQLDIRIMHEYEGAVNDLESVVFNEPIKVGFKVVDEFAEDYPYYSFIQGNYTFSRANDYEVTREKFNEFVYYQTSKVDVDAEDKIYEAGDTVDLDFTITNEAVHKNILELGFEAEGLELVALESKVLKDLDSSLWMKTDTGYRIKLKDNSNKWIQFDGNQEFTIKATFKIDEDYDQATLPILGYLATMADSNYIKYSEEELILRLKEQQYSIKYDLNGGTGETPVDATLYSSDDTVKLAESIDFDFEGYSFKGWSLKEDGPILLNTIMISEMLDAENIDISEITLYAQWKKNESPEKPADPGKPTIPEIPEKPEKPADPGKPTIPEEPVNPIAEKPDKPATPAIPELRIPYTSILLHY